MSFIDQIRNAAELPLAFGYNAPSHRLGARPAARIRSLSLPSVYADIHEGLMLGAYRRRLVYVSTYDDLPPSRFLGLPIGIEMQVADTGEWRTVNGLIAQARVGASDGELTCYEFTLVDAVTLLRGKSQFAHLQEPVPARYLAHAVHRLPDAPRLSRGLVDLDLSRLDSARYPVRAFTRQADEPDGGFIERLARRDGIAYFVRAGDRTGKSGRENPVPMHTIAMFDDPLRLPRIRAGTLRYRRSSSTDTVEGITSMACTQSITPGRATLQSRDLQDPPAWTKRRGPVRSTTAPPATAWRPCSPTTVSTALTREIPSRIWTGLRGPGSCRMTIAPSGAISRAMWWASASPNGSNWRIYATGLQARGRAAVRHDRAPPADVEQPAKNAGRTRTAASWRKPFALAGSVRNSAFRTGCAPLTGDRYEIAFSCVPRGIPLTPVYEPRIDLPSTPPILGRVVAAAGHAAIDGRIRPCLGAAVGTES